MNDSFVHLATNAVLAIVAFGGPLAVALISLSGELSFGGATAPFPSAPAAVRWRALISGRAALTTYCLLFCGVIVPGSGGLSISLSDLLFGAEGQAQLRLVASAFATFGALLAYGLARSVTEAG